MTTTNGHEITRMGNRIIGDGAERLRGEGAAHHTRERALSQLKTQRRPRFHAIAFVEFQNNLIRSDGNDEPQPPERPIQPEPERTAREQLQSKCYRDCHHQSNRQSLEL